MRIANVRTWLLGAVVVACCWNALTESCRAVNCAVTCIDTVFMRQIEGGGQTKWWTLVGTEPCKKVIDYDSNFGTQGGGIQILRQFTRVDQGNANCDPIPGLIKASNCWGAWFPPENKDFVCRERCEYDQ